MALTSIPKRSSPLFCCAWAKLTFASGSCERWTAGCAAVYSRDVGKDMWQASVDRSWRFLKLAVRFVKQSNFAAEAQGV